MERQGSGAVCVEHLFAFEISRGAQLGLVVLLVKCFSKQEEQQLLALLPVGPEI